MSFKEMPAATTSPTNVNEVANPGPKSLLQTRAICSLKGAQAALAAVAELKQSEKTQELESMLEKLIASSSEAISKLASESAYSKKELLDLADALQRIENDLGAAIESL